MDDECDCEDCIESGESCARDCSSDDQCVGCNESEEETKEREHEVMCALGYK